MATPVVAAGDYTVLLDTGFDANSFTLNDATKGLLDGNYELGPQSNYADITEYVTRLTYRRGRRKPDDQFAAGILAFVMRDETGILGPYDSTSPYYDPANDQPGLAPMRAVQVLRESTPLFTGFVTAYDYQFELAGPNLVYVSCADDFYKLAQTNLDELNVTAETSGERIETVLALPEVDYTGTTSIATGTVNLGHDSSYTVPDGTNTLGYLTQINQAEQGRIFCAADGTLTFQERIGQTLSAPAVDFHDDGTETPYDGLEVAFDADNVVNRAVVIALNNNTATDSDAGSIATYFTQNKTITNSLLHLQSEIDALAAYLLEPDPEPRYTAVSTTFAMLTDAQRDACALIDIGNTIAIEKTIPGLGSEIGTELAVEGIYGEITFDRGHRITYYTSPTTIVYELVLDDATYGTLNSTNVLG
jgi:hypothetical protein